jgi:hypothetical protein
MVSRLVRSMAIVDGKYSGDDSHHPEDIIVMFDNRQERNILDFLVDSISANRAGDILPSLLP